MKAIELINYGGLESLRMTDVMRPRPAQNEILIEVKAAGINFAELELAHGRYSTGKEPPFVMGFEAAGTVVEAGSDVKHLRVGDAVTSLVSSGGYAEYATAVAEMAIPIPRGINFAEAASIPVQGLSAYTMLNHVARPTANETLLIQSAAGGIGIYLLQLAKLAGVRKVVALAGGEEKLKVVRSLGADVAIDSSRDGWTEEVLDATKGKGVDVVLEAAAGEFGRRSFGLLAPFGRMIVFGSRNVHDVFSSEQMRQLILKNQSVTGFNFPSLRPQLITSSVAPLMGLIAERKLRLFAHTSFPLENVREAMEAIARRATIGKVVLTPGH